MMTIDETIHVLEGLPKYIFDSETRDALVSAVYHLREASPKPDTSEDVINIKHYVTNRDKWGTFRLDDKGETIEFLPISTLIEWAKNGTLDNGKFGSCLRSKVRKMDSRYVDDIKYMLIRNGYVTREEVYHD